MRAAVFAAFVFALCALPACSSNRGRGGDAGGGGGGNDTGIIDLHPDVQWDDTGFNGSACSDNARWIYLVDSTNHFLRFEPDTNTITSIGLLACPSSGSPFSMGVSRDATAYVLYSDHSIYSVSTADASCTTSGWVPNAMGFEQFGMGFVSNSAGSTDETLFIAGGAAAGIGSGLSNMGSVQLADWSVMRFGTLDGSPELTGNGNAELWGFFPDASPMSVRQLDKTNGATIQQFDVSAIDTSFLPTPSAWAFAFWGGRYYIFYQGALDTSTNIWRLTPDTGAIEPVMMSIGYRVVGAGVSTCAPTHVI
jgi:hypothetical protein